MLNKYMSNDIDMPTPRALERHVQTVLGVIVVGLISWTGVSLNKMQQNVAGMTVKIEQLQTEVAYLRQFSADRYTSQQAGNDWNRNRVEMDEIRQRLRAVERKVQ